MENIQWKRRLARLRTGHLARNNSKTTTPSTSKDCLHEINLAHENNLKIIPILKNNIDWNDNSLSHLGLNNKRFFTLEGKQINTFYNEIYDFICEYKEKIGLFDKKRQNLIIKKVEKIIIIRELFDKFLESKKFKNNLKEKSEKLELLIEKFKNQEINRLEFLNKFFLIYSNEKHVFNSYT
ncbi:MAG: hypothetical protein ACFFD2_01990 [Promethearchaeota archaeon]